MHLVEVRAIVTGPFFEVEDMHFTDYQLWPLNTVGIEQLPQVTIDVMYILMSFVVKVQLQVVVAHRLVHDPCSARIRRIATQLWVLHDEVGSVDPETIHTSLQPEARDVEHGSFDLRV